MTPQEAKIFGRTKALKATGIVATILLVVFLFMQTRGDFANGILFFFDAILNIHLIVILTILFGSTFLLGGKAGKEIILDKKNFITTSIKYAVIIILTIIIYAAIIGITKDNASSSDNFARLLMKYFLTPLVKTGSLTIISMLAIWLWATNQMRLIAAKKTE